MRGSIRALKSHNNPHVEGLMNALRYTTKHLNDEDTPKSVRQLLMWIERGCRIWRAYFGNDSLSTKVAPSFWNAYSLSMCVYVCSYVYMLLLLSLLLLLFDILLITLYPTDRVGEGRASLCFHWVLYEVYISFVLSLLFFVLATLPSSPYLGGLSCL